MRPLLKLLLCCPIIAFAQQPGTTEPSPAMPCTDAAYRQFDFWIGEWEVTEDGSAAGTNSIRAVHGGCAVEENWRGASGLTGSSFNIYDQATGHWHQTWVDSQGTLLQLDGGMVGGAMVLSGERPARDGSAATTHRITWTPGDDGSLRQLWEVSRDGGQSWSVSFDGHYQPLEDSR